MKKYIVLFIGIGLLFVNCKKDDAPMMEGEGEEQGAVELNSEVNDFIWKGMNYWYFWQADQPDLADDRFADDNAYHTFLNGYSSSQDLFDDLVYQPNVVDDFSWYIPDVEEQLASFRGTNKSYGLGLGSLVREQPDSDNVVIYITYVSPNSPASAAGLKRGDLIYKVDGTVMTVDNFDVINNVFRNESITFGIGSYENDVFVPNDGEDISLTAELLTVNPVHYSDILEISGKRIGYVVYNGFRSTFNGELNDVFGTFTSEGIDELILDMRYNRGGSVLTSAFLASMINGNVPAESDAFARLEYNPKRNPDNGVIFPFFNIVAIYDKTTSDFIETVPSNRLENISTLYVITSEDTASASEMIINGLRPYMNVIIIGETTTGKNEGSITVVDAPASGDSDPYTDLDNRNPNHTIGMQPIVFQVFNSNNESDYTFGFEPDILVEEFRFAKDIRPFGDPQEALLKATLDRIFGTTSKSLLSLDLDMHKMDVQLKEPKFSSEMYIGPNEADFMKQ